MATRRSTARRAGTSRLAPLTPIQLQLRIELKGVKPAIWRCILVPETVTLSKLHGILQWTMGWSDSHLHEYEIARRRYGTPDEDGSDPEPLLDERRVRLKAQVDAGVRKFHYLYDFGDHWEHTITIEGQTMRREGTPAIFCVAGENACPPDDVGGIHGYAEFLKAIADPKHEEHAAMLEWAGGSFNPRAFDLDRINAYLLSIRG